MNKTMLFMVLIVMGTVRADAQLIQDGSFEEFDVADGATVMAPDGPWTWANDAGVVDPFLPNSSNGALMNTASGTFDPMDGEQYATTYAGADRVTQSVNFTEAGIYELSVWAAAPEGLLTIPLVFVDRPLITGGFQFVFQGSSIGEVHMLEPGTSWTQFSTAISVPLPGEYSLGVRNVVQASYFINYDEFTLRAIPEPRNSVLGVTILMLCGFRSILRRNP